MIQNRNYGYHPSLELIDLDEIPIEALGMHLMFGDIETSSVKNAIEFIIKGNALLNQDLVLMVNTVGGDTSEGFALIDVMEASRLPVQTVGLGNIISMGMLVMCAGTKGKRVMMKNSCAMAHQFSGYLEGKFHELVATQKAFTYLKEQMVGHFVRHTKMTEKQVNDVLFAPSDRYLTPTECKKYGIIDHVVEELPNLAAIPDPSQQQPQHFLTRSVAQPQRRKKRIG